MKREPARWSLASKLLLFACGSTLLGALVIGWVAIDATQRTLEASVDHGHPTRLAQAASLTRSWLEAGQAAAQAVAGQTGPDTPIAGLQQLVHRHPEIRSLAWIDAAASGARASDGLTEQLTEARLREIAARDQAGTVSVVAAGAEPCLGVWLPSRGGGGVLAVLDHAELAAALDAQLPHPESHILLTGDAGTPLLALAGKGPALQIGIDPSQLERRGARGGMLQHSVDGHSLLAAALPLHVAGLHLVLQTPYEAAYAPIRALVRRILAVAAGSILLVSLVAYGLSARTLHPIEALSEVARRVAGGETDVEIPEVRSRDEVGVLARTLAEMLHEIRAHRQQLESANQSLLERNARLESVNEVLNQLSITDGLTQLHNHRFFQDHLTREIKRVTRNGEPLSMLVIDIDDFKKLNDRHGHAAGDEVLRRIARMLEENVRESDLLARYGGEEFVILACGTNLPGARVLAEKVRTSIAETSFIVDDSLRPLRITVSVGVAQYSGNRKRFFAEADDALYRAKAAGKNCVVAAE